MKRVGNAVSNRKYNPQNKKPPVPVDADEADSAMERFIRSKYVQSPSSLNRGVRQSGTSESDEGTPPPLPPKTGTKFFKATSGFPLSFRSRKASQSDVTHPPPPHEHLRNKPSKVFGASVQQDTVEDTAQKLTQLRDMGFLDDKRNAMILKGVNGNLEKTIEALVRLGEGALSPASLNAPPDPFPQSSRSLSPNPPRTPTTGGYARASPAASPASNNPWDVPPPAQPQSSQSTGTLPNKNPFLVNNPFGMPTQQAGFTLNQSLQNLSLAPPQQQQQPLFPHHTGGLPASQPTQPVTYQQPMTPTLPSTQNYASTAFNYNQTFPQPSQQPYQGYNNPFLQTSGHQPQHQQLPSLTTSSLQPQSTGAGNPFARSPTRITSPLGQIPEQSQQNFYSAPQSLYGNNPFLALNQSTQQMPPVQPAPAPLDQSYYQAQFQQQQQQQALSQPQQQQYQQQQQPQYQQQPQQQSMAQHNKASILALYDYPSLAPAPLPQVPEQSSPAPPVEPAMAAPPAPSSGTRNPFMNAAAPQSAPSASGAAPFGSARSRESMTLGMEMSWNNGRHSPDAFASLSARSG